MTQAITSRKHPAVPPDSHDGTDLMRISESAAAVDGGLLSMRDFHRWFDERRKAIRMDVRRIPFAELKRWSFQPVTGNLVHDSGRFFSVEGLRARYDGPDPVSWSQPIMNQPEIGFLGILVKEFDGVLHCLMQAKAEPGNAEGLQLSPTVQATRSNYTGVHEGSAVRYLEYFTDPGKGRPLVDVLQSEHGAWFYRKRNRNLVVEAVGDVPEHEDYCWLTLGQVRRLLGVPDLVNMDTRTVLACLPVGPLHDPGHGAAAALTASLSPQADAAHTLPDILRWFNGIRARSEVSLEPVPLAAVDDWVRDAEEIRHTSGRHFAIVAVSVEAGNREVTGWTQPLLSPRGTGVVAFLAKRINGVLHVLVRAHPEPGYVDVVELGPTVQCVPDNHAHLPPERRPRFLDDVLAARPEQILYDVVQSEEGGRFYRALSRYLVVETDEDPLVPVDYRWMTVGQLVTLLQHSNYCNIQARSLIACLQSVW
ncbi:NDP-hexose 2,3-dehydratase family protein [Streptomyces sp. NPDC003753]|uniref:NDP-hexose 2,3-dehydratase family protein n=1 Tax=unclassified Streptomyces TaxID=2593676 RepID=UPI001A4D3A52|nr:NDP-hexose 2,3-dehydratase family protein [Streptomyces sp. Y2F8-2]GHK04164.1 NDP-hexose 2,3-dehydratase [Streptomyces sp. Y2F8-2]